MSARPAFWVSVGAVVLAALSRGSGLDPPSFWLDDQWAALVYRDFSWSEIFRLRPPIPLGFVLLQKPFSGSLVGLQWIPFVASGASIMLVTWTVERVTRSFGAATCVALTAAGVSLLAMSAVHPKHYAVDVLVVATLLAHFVPVFAADPSSGERKNLWVIAVCAVGFCFSFASVFVAVPLAHLAAWRLRRRDFWGAVGAYDVLLAVAYGVLLGRSGSDAMTSYWAHAFAPVGSVGEALAFLVVRVPVALGAALPSPWLAWLAVPGAIWLLRAPKLRWLGVACLGSYAAAIVAAFAHIHPFGTGRTDLFLGPVTLLLIGCGLHALVSLAPGFRLRQVLMVVAGLALVGSGWGRVAYLPDTRDAELVSTLDERRRPGEAVLVFPHAAFALAFHGDWDYRPVPASDYAHGFDVVFDSPDVSLLPGVAGYLGRPHRLDPALDTFLASAPDRVHYFATPLLSPAYRGAHAHVLRRLADRGYRVTWRSGTRNAELLLLEREATSR